LKPKEIKTPPVRFARFRTVGSLPAVILATALTLASAHAGDAGSAGKPPLPARRVSGILGSPRSSLMNINNVSMWASDNGMMERRPADFSAGVTFPRGTATVVYAAGFLWCGKVFDGTSPVLRVGGQTYNEGTLPGRIVRPGVAENPQNADVRIYRIRRDWATADLRQDAAEIFGVALPQVTAEQIQETRDQYRQDWLEWPWENGAPFYERDGNPGYQPAPDASPDSSFDEPGLAGADQVLWFVANDLDPDATGGLYGSPPIGMEMQITCWAYAHAENLKNVVYQRCRLIYKGTATTPSTARIDSLYLAKWADPDIGDYIDDYAGYSVPRGLGYVYNSVDVDSKFAGFGLVPPVVGYDMVGTPRVARPGSTAHWDLKSVQGYENLPPTAFFYFNGASRTGDFLLGSYTGTIGWWNILRGYAPFTSPPQCLIDPTSGECTSFELPGDPLTQEGWVDGRFDLAGDRRFVLSSGPVSMALGDTQEVVTALIGAIGTESREGITPLEATDDDAQDAFNLNFESPDPVPEPSLRIVELENKLILDWEKDTAQTRRIESYRSKGYRFETYRIYQFPLPGPGTAGAKELPAFVVSSPRFVTVTSDLFRKGVLINGQQYYYAVTAVMQNPDRSLTRQRIESPLVVHTCTPHSPNPGTIYPYAAGDLVPSVKNFVGINDAAVNVVYFDPTQPDGHVYKVLFHVPHDQQEFLDKKPRWDFIDSTSNDTLLHRIRMDTVAARIPTRGMTVQATSPLFAMKGVFETETHFHAARNFVFNTPNPGKNYMVVAAGTSDLDTLRGGSTQDLDVELRFTGDSSWTVFVGPLPRTSRWVRVPFTAWHVLVNGGDTTYRQLYTAMTSTGADSVWRPVDFPGLEYNDIPVKATYPVTIMVDSFATLGGTYHDDITLRSDSALVKAYIWANCFSKTIYSAIWRAYFADIDGDGVAVPNGTVVRFEAYKEVRDLDEKLFQPAAVLKNDLTAARREIDRINVFPNPYYGMNRAELNRFQRFVTFNHLPWSATIRIFNLAGIHVRTISKNDDSQFATWDLNNESGLPVAGGLYLAHLELQDAKGTDLGDKTLKLMIVREEQALGGGR
jgi:hypothetical protein